jgi:anti-sigma B factor antagonist
MPSSKTRRRAEIRSQPTQPKPPGQTADIAGSELAIKIHHDDSHSVVVDVTGELDALTAPRLLDALRSLLRERSSVLVVDLTEVAFMGSAGISVLVDTHQRSPHVDLRVVAATLVTLRPLQVTGLDSVLNIYPSRAAALGRNGQRPQPRRPSAPRIVT